jgi:hypothetical protein
VLFPLCCISFICLQVFISPEDCSVFLLSAVEVGILTVTIERLNRIIFSQQNELINNDVKSKASVIDNHPVNNGIAEQVNPKENSTFLEENIRESESIILYNGDLIISINSITYNGSPLSYKVNGSIGGKRMSENISMNLAEVGNVFLFSNYEIRIKKITIFDVVFLIYKLD